jgi:hypothetical protein
VGSGNNWNRYWQQTFGVLALFSKRFMIVTHFGINNQTFTNGGAAGVLEQRYGAGKKPGLFFHDAWNEYAVFFPEKTKMA